MKLITAAFMIFAATTAGATGTEKSEDAKSQLMRIIVAVQCPDVPQAFEVAKAKALAYSAAHPDELPQTDLAEAIRIAGENAATETNPIATALCQRIVEAG